MKRTSSKRPVKPVRTTTRSRSKSKKSLPYGKMMTYGLVTLFLLFLLGMAYNYRNGFLYYLGFKTDKNVNDLTEEERKLEDIRIFEVLSRHDTKVVGFDVSEYQSKIAWGKIDKVEDDFPLEFVFVRATAGNDRPDRRFKENWKAAKEHYFIRGAYHYYRPNENSIEQAENFIKVVKLKKGDFPPVLDIEKLPKNQSIDSLKIGLRRWLKHVERHYKVKPIIYTGESYYTDFLKDEFKGYTFWIANYNFFVETIKDDWKFWQFTEKAKIQGIEGLVDVNIFNGSKEELKRMLIK
ncbi:glycoside hydrolase family 25 protein [Flavobacterium sp. SM15]|uniref:glycoside hydrolase family 25 protein n=1 Tax=Flavobacterium sp. SM15 TaxID=2908005 RepID=UPI001EDA9AA2|nr:glycoside hydrolase family 25 protein [Flavobacterium sp. SM15]MCG2611236.1 glycoside hydrolase family 25 protein [Flavobacterium sp. SM15]